MILAHWGWRRSLNSPSTATPRVLGDASSPLLSPASAASPGAWSLIPLALILVAAFAVRLVAALRAPIIESDGAFYAGNSANPSPQLFGTGKSNGWFGGTNVKGHQIIATYSFTDFLNFTFIYYRNDAIIKSFAVADNRSDAGHFMADLNWKF